jgi:hypothetical protein
VVLRIARFALTALAVVAGTLALAVAPVVAQEESWGASYVTPFPENDTYRLQVIGDFMAEGLLSGLTEAMAGDARVQMPRRHLTMAGLLRESDDLAAFEDAIGKEPLHIAVLMFGIGDRIPLRGPNNRRVAVGSEEWKTEYARRVDRLIRVLKRRGTAIYWVSLPIVRRSDMGEDVQMLNDVFRERALIANVKFIDVYAAFADENGAFNQYGPDLTGKSRLMREGDGVAFTAAGNRKLAHFVEREVKRDVTQARNERNIPLAGSEADQKRISPKPQQQAATAPQTGWGSAITPAPKAKDGAPRNPGGAAAAVAAAGGELKADSSKVSVRLPGRFGRDETVNIEIVRPAIPASVVALVTRRASPDRPMMLGDNVPDALGGGTVVLNSITPGLAAGSQAQRQRLAPTQSPFFRVLVKGERLPPRPGRVDDFRWPRPNADAKAAVDPNSVQPRPEPAVADEGAPRG